MLIAPNEKRLEIGLRLASFNTRLIHASAGCAVFPHTSKRFFLTRLALNDSCDPRNAGI